MPPTPHGDARTTAAPTCPSRWSARRVRARPRWPGFSARRSGCRSSRSRPTASAAPGSSTTVSPSRLERTINTDDPERPLLPEDGRRPCGDDPTMHVPPCIVFIDEVHGLPRDVRDGLLKAIESKDGCCASRAAGTPTAGTSAGSWRRPSGASSSVPSTPASRRSSWGCTVPKRSPPSSSSTSHPLQDGLGFLETGFVHWGILSGRKSPYCTLETVTSQYPMKFSPPEPPKTQDLRRKKPKRPKQKRHFTAMTTKHTAIYVRVSSKPAGPCLPAP